eukprot:2766001-Pleurochrysis_carterae.AAC.1
MGRPAGIRALHLSGSVADSLWAFRAVRFAPQSGGGVAVQLADAGGLGCRRDEGDRCGTWH